MSSVELLGPAKGKHFIKHQKAVSLYSWISYTGATTVHCSECSQYCRGDAAAPVPPDVSQPACCPRALRGWLFLVAWILSRFFR